MVWSDLKDMMVNHDSKMIAFEQRIDRRFEVIERRIDTPDQKFSKYFLWMIGIQVSVLLAIIAIMLR